MSEIVERGAIAIHKTGIFPTSIPWENCVELYREERRMRARAVIEEMREPTKEVLLAGMGACLDDHALEVWQAMIDEILK